MRRLRCSLIWGALIVAALLLAGCSGSGVSPGAITGTDLRALAADHLSAVQLFFGWLAVLYQPLAADVPPPDMETFPDGTLRMWGTTSDGGAYEWFLKADGSGNGTITWPDATAFSSAWDATIWNDDWTIARDHVVNTYPNGASIDTNIVNDGSNPAQFHATWEGTAATAGGATMDFTLDRQQLDRDELRLELPDGVVLALRVPIQDLDLRPNWPRFADGATGALSLPGRGDMDFRVTGEDGWNQWELTCADGTTGVFALAADAAGTGQLTREGQPAAALRWTQAGIGTLDLLGAGVEEVTPSAPARDFRLDQWVRNTALLGPAPIY